MNDLENSLLEIITELGKKNLLSAGDIVSAGKLLSRADKLCLEVSKFVTARYSS